MGELVQLHAGVADGCVGPGTTLIPLDLRDLEKTRSQLILIGAAVEMAQLAVAQAATYGSAETLRGVRQIFEGLTCLLA